MIIKAKGLDLMIDTSKFNVIQIVRRKWGKEDFSIEFFATATKRYSVGMYAGIERAREVFDDIYNAIARGERVYAMPEK